MTTPKVLGQVKPSANTVTALVTVGASKTAVISTVTVCNLGAFTTYRIAVRPSGATLEDKHYVAFDCGIGPNTTDTITLGIGLGANDVMDVSTPGTLAFGAFGAEV